MTGILFGNPCADYRYPSDKPHISSVVITSDIGFQREPVVRISYPSGLSIEFFGKVGVESIKKLL
jgi:hypothetical protein